MILPARIQRPVTERDILNDIRAALAREPGVWVVRNNVGKLKDENGRLVTFGLGTGSADLVGTTDGNLFFAVEVKTPATMPTLAKLDRIGERHERGEALSKHDRHLLDQWNWIRFHRRRGAMCGFACTVVGALGILAGIQDP